MFPKRRIGIGKEGVFIKIRNSATRAKLEPVGAQDCGSLTNDRSHLLEVHCDHARGEY